MSLDIISCRIAPPGGTVRSRAWDISSGLDKFVPLASFTRQRRINWERSFALKGLPHSAYRLETNSFLKNRFRWHRSTHADAALPQTVTFDATDEGQGLQGDVFIYERQCLQLHIEERPSSFLADAVKPQFFDAFPQSEWVSDAKRLDQLHSLLLPERCDEFLTEILKPWDPERSVVRVSY